MFFKYVANVKINGTEIKFDADGVYNAISHEEIDFLTRNSFYKMPRKMVEVYLSNKAIKPVTKKKEKKSKDGDNYNN